MATQILDYTRVDQALRDHLTKALTEAAEPILKEALRDMEVEMRKRLAVAVIGMIESGYQVERDASLLVIRVDLGRMTRG